MPRPHRAEGLVTEAFKVVPLPHPDMESPKAPRTITMREHVRLDPSSAPVIPTVAVDGTTCMWGTEKWVEEAQGVFRAPMPVSAPVPC